MIGYYMRQSGSLFYMCRVDRSHDQLVQGYRLRRGGHRNVVAEFSTSSRRRMRGYLREAVAVYGYMWTLTYPGASVTDGKTVKRDLKVFLQRMQRYCKNTEGFTSGCTCASSFFWFIEFQERGAPHFHILCNRWVPKSVVSRCWFEVVGSDDERHLHAGTRVESVRGGNEGMASYVEKYADKTEQKDVPAGYENVGRFWGVVGFRGTVSAATFVAADVARVNREVAECFEGLKGKIRELLKAKQAKLIKKTEDFYCVKLIGISPRVVMRCEVNKLSMLTQYWEGLPDDYGEIQD
jgi:hypothetical protein